MINPKLETLTSKQTQNPNYQNPKPYNQEATELTKIFGSIVEKCR